MKIVKKLLVLFLLINLIFAFCYVYSVKASTSVKLEPNYTESGSKVRGFGRTLFGLIRNIAAISSVLLLAYCGMRIVFGSVEQKAEYKKALMPLIIGCLIVLCATGIVTVVQNTFTPTKTLSAGSNGRRRRPEAEAGMVMEER